MRVLWRLGKIWYDCFGWCVHYPGFGWLAPLGEKVRLRYYADPLDSERL